MKRLFILVLLLASTQALAAPGLFSVEYIDTSRFVERGYITFYADLLDRNFTVIEPAPDLPQWEVYADGQPLVGGFEVLRLDEVDEPTAVALVIGAHSDYVASITGAEGESALSVFDLEKEAVKEFIQKLDSGSNDQVAVYIYYEDILDEAVAFTSNMTQARDSIDNYILKKRTAKLGTDGMPISPKLYKNVTRVVQNKMAENPDMPRRKVLVVMSDGRDQKAENAKQIQKRIKTIVESAEETGVKIFTIGFTLDTPKYLTDFHRLATGSGGVAKTIKMAASDPVPEIATAFEEVVDILKKQLVVRFSPEDIEDGKMTSFKLKVKDPSASSEYPRQVQVPERPFNFVVILVIVGIVLGGLILLIVIIKIIGGILRARRERAESEGYEEEYVGPSKGRLMCTDGAYAGQVSHMVEDVTRIGSMAGSQVQIMDEGVSRRHAAIRVEEMRYEIADLGSTNGTFVNDHKITKAFLKDGDLIRVGNTVMKFHLK